MFFCHLDADDFFDAHAHSVCFCICRGDVDGCRKCNGDSFGEGCCDSDDDVEYDCDGGVDVDGHGEGNGVGFGCGHGDICWFMMNELFRHDDIDLIPAITIATVTATIILTALSRMRM